MRERLITRYKRTVELQRRARGVWHDMPFTNRLLSVLLMLALLAFGLYLMSVLLLFAPEIFP